MLGRQEGMVAAEEDLLSVLALRSPMKLASGWQWELIGRQCDDRDVEARRAQSRPKHSVLVLSWPGADPSSQGMGSTACVASNRPNRIGNMPRRPCIQLGPR